jgi:hypothetical protein
VYLLEQLDPKRHDALAILDAIGDFGQLSDAEQDDHLGLWAYSGMDEAQHPLTVLLREGHNATCVVRDLDGTLQFLWQENSTSDRWSRGPLYREHLMDDEELGEAIEDDPRWLDEREISLPLDSLYEVLARLRLRRVRS